MLDTINPWGARLRPYVSPQIRAQIATDAWQVAAYQRLRAQIFCAEQALFAESDLDEWDGKAYPIVALSELGGMSDDVVGVVRIYEQAPGVWFGGRLGVSEAYRRRGAVGGALIECAVSSAHALGCHTFLATIQLQNVRYFERYWFRCLEPISVCGVPHQLMQADLAHYPPRPVPRAAVLGAAAASRRAVA